MNWTEEYKRIRPVIERSKNIYKKLSIGCLIGGVILLLPFAFFAGILLLLSLIFFIYYRITVRSSPYVLTGVCLGKEKVEMRIDSHSDVGDSPVMYIQHYIRFRVNESFELISQGKGRSIAKNLKTLDKFYVKDSIYDACLKDRVLSLVFLPDNDMIGFVTDQQSITFKLPMPNSSATQSKYCFTGDTVTVLERIEF